MSYYRTVFNQLFNFIPRHRFDKCVTELKGDHYCKGFTAWKQFLVLLYSQISGKDSLRQIESGLLMQRNKLYHLGLDPVPRSTLSDAMAARDPVIVEELFYDILQRAVQVSPGHKFKFKNPLYSIDATTIDLCLSIYDWAKFRKRKGAIKLHCQLDHRGHLPVFMHLSDGKTHDVSAAKEHISITPDSIYCVDKAYVDFSWLDSINSKKAFFVTRMKTNLNFRITGQHDKANMKKGVLADEIIELTGWSTRKKYPKKLRMVTYLDNETGGDYTFITNNFKLSASTIAEIYHQRWQIELFFKWIKQNLKLKTFIGTSRNAVLWQVWVAMIYYLLLSYIKFLSKISLTITELCGRIGDTLMERLDLLEIMSLSRKDIKKPPDFGDSARQPDLFSYIS
jgi:hypothetical protein